MQIPINYYAKQAKFFFDLNTKYRILLKGRRTGFTHGAANYVIESALANEEKKILWVDTIHANIDRYVNRYFLPTLKHLNRSKYNWSKQAKEMTILQTAIDFRSSDRAENIEGFGYHAIIINEAGIILKGERGRYIWQNAILPMTMDYDCTVFFGGTPKGITDKTGQETLYYALWQKTKNNPNWSGLTVATNENPFLNQEAVQEVKEELPEGSVRDQEFYGRFTRSKGTIINPDLFYVSDIPFEGTKVRYWDLAFSTKKSADDTAGCLICNDGADRLQVQDIKSTKALWSDTIELIVNTAINDGQDTSIFIETNGQQLGFLSDLQRETRLRHFCVDGINSEKDKLSRALRWVARAQRGEITFLRGEYIEKLFNQCRSFTSDDTHSHDDCIDSVSGAYNAITDGTAGITVI